MRNNRPGTMVAQSVAAILIFGLLFVRPTCSGTGTGSGRDNQIQNGTQAALQAAVFALEDRAFVRFRVATATAFSASSTEAPLRGHCTVTQEEYISSTIPQAPAVVWSGDIAHVDLSDDSTRLSVVPKAAPTPWDLFSPVLHRLECFNLSINLPKPHSFRNISVRFGFRYFAADNSTGTFRLNGRPIFLRGNSINPPGRDLPAALSQSHEFATAYLTYMRDVAHVNALRIGDGVDSSTQHWYDAADEVGMLIYAGPYNNVRCTGCSDKPAFAAPPDGAADEAFRQYKDVLFAAASHPSFVILIMGNEYDIAGPDRSHWWESNGVNPFALDYRALAANVSGV